jgi:glutaredoxin
VILLKIVKVEGEKKDHRVFIYALSTCGWCKMTKKFMGDSGIAYEYVDVDKASSEEKREIGDTLKERNIPLGFPITIINHDVVITGYKPDRFREELGL